MLLQHYLANDQKLKKYVPLIKDSIVYPAIYDSQRTLLSLPPIINGAHSAVSRTADHCGRNAKALAHGTS
jgi:phenylalanyl-tRNA synthetase beta chain